MNRKPSFENSMLEMEKKLIEINSLIEETKSCMIEINTNYQMSNGGINPEILQEEFELKEMILDSLLQKKAEIEATLMMNMAKELMKSNKKLGILKLAHDPYRIEKIYLGTLIIVCIGAIFSIWLR
jgi:flagellar basal body-associated protein FliL